VGNFIMGCSFHVSAAMRIMIQYNINILAIQEHTAWNRDLLPHELTSIERHYDKWGYFVKISKLQILIIDKQLQACHWETTVQQGGRILKCRCQISKQQYVTFIPVYGIPHSNDRVTNNENTCSNDNNTLQAMRIIHEQIKKSIGNAKNTGGIIFIVGDLQDTPDNTSKFHYGKCRIPKHPLGVIKVCKEANLSCSIYQHLESLDKPIISRHGIKGGRFIDSMYTCDQGLGKILGISLINDTGINSDHVIVLNKIDLGIEKFKVTKKREERIDFRRIMNIPVPIK